ncbi:uncharacterized protein CEXT_786821 [Caerostris extrusa]|uniref:Vitellogenin domain-containing protein n=1 Tax=Caerostris extrusa TaxID=172846 RepID=A0AAV4M802_CAEEX|nr:uncharacterized protein CEXT_786821 [Caerostris extrusa]
MLYVSEFMVGKTQTYDLVINMTASVPGMRPQVAKSVLMGELKIFAKSKNDLIMTVNDVKVSESLPSVNSDVDHVVLKGSKILDDLLKLPIKSRYENGKTNSVGSYVSHYVVTHSPYEVFPHEFSVFNISRTDNYEVLPYETYKTHHNFDVQGCRKECKQNQRENAFGAGCPLEYEQFQTPMKRSFVQQHNLRTLPGGVLIIDSVKTKETHVADIYEQNMQVAITSSLARGIQGDWCTNHVGARGDWSSTNHVGSRGDWCTNHKWLIYAAMQVLKKIKIAKTLLQQVAEIVVRGDIGNRTSNLISEKIFLLRKVLTNLKQIDLRHLEHSIVSYYKMQHASEIDIVKRQIWLDILPVIGTEDSTSYITNIIQENVNKPDKSISLWEASSVLAAVPSNLKQVTGRTLLDLMRLLELVSESNEPGYTIFYSASYLTVARAIAKACVIEKGAAEDEDEKKLVIDEINLILQKLSVKKQRKPAFTCSKPIVNRFVDDVVSKLTNSDDIAKRVIYIETLSRTALQEVLPYLLSYLYGKVSDLSPSDTDFMKLVAIKSLHNLVDFHPLDKAFGDNYMSRSPVFNDTNNIWNAERRLKMMNVLGHP